MNASSSVFGTKVISYNVDLAKLGYELKDVEESYGKVPFTLNPSPDDRAMKVISSDIEGLKIGDLITKINSVDLNSDQANTLRRNYAGLTRSNKVGEKWIVTVKSGDESKVVNVEIVAGLRKLKKVVSMDKVSPVQFALRKKFESAKRN